MISMPVPGIVQLIQNVLLNLIYVDVLMTDSWLPQIIYGGKNEATHEDEEPLNDYFEENGFKSRVLMKNLGSTIVYLALYFIIWLTLGILYLFKNIV